MKIIARRPAGPGRYPMLMLVPVSFDGKAIPPGGLVEVSDMQVAEIIMRSLGEAALPSEVAAAATIHVARTRAVIRWKQEQYG